MVVPHNSTTYLALRLPCSTDTLPETNKRLDVMVAKAKKLQDHTGVSLLWGTSNCFTHPRFMAGAATNPSPEVFAYAASQIKKPNKIALPLAAICTSRSRSIAWWRSVGLANARFLTEATRREVAEAEQGPAPVDCPLADA